MPSYPVEVFANNPSTTVSSGGTSAPSGGTQETWTVASSASFPGVTQGATQFHVIDPALPTEIAAVIAVSGTTWTVARGAETTTPVAHTAGFTVIQVVTAGALTGTGASPWQFLPESYGARGDGKIVGDVVTNATTTITSATAGFVNATAPAGDVGKYIMIHGANGTTSGPLRTTIASVTNATTAVLAAAAGASITGCPAVYGTDDTAAIAAAAAAAGTYATTAGAVPGSGGYFAQVLFAAKIYILGTGPTQVGNGTTTATFNSQVPLPYPAINGTSQKLVIELAGAGPADHNGFWESTIPNLAGTCLVSMVTAPGPPNATFGVQSVIGGPSQNAGFTGTFANVKASIRNLSVWCYAYTNQCALDLAWVAGCHVDGVSCHVFAPGGFNGGAAPYQKDFLSQGAFTSSYGVGARFPAVGNNNDVTVPSFATAGYPDGLRVGDFFAAGRIATNFNVTALKIDQATGLTGICHLCTIGNFAPEVYNTGILATGGGGSSGFLNISMDAECTGVVADITDTSNTLHGIVYWSDPADARSPTVSGAANLKIIDARNNGPGPWSGAPAAPASATAQQNTAWRDATIYASATTSITNTGVGPASGSLTALGQVAAAGVKTMFRVPSGQWFSVTYTGTLTTIWVLE